MKNSPLTLAVLAGCLSLAQLASATPAIGINFGSEWASLAPSDTAGVIAQANWNNAANALGSLTNILDSTDSTTTADVTWDSSNTWSNPSSTIPLLQGYLDGNSDHPVTVTVKEIPFTLYDVYVYINGGSSTTTSTYTVNGQTQTVTPSLNASTLNLATATTSGVVDPGARGSYILFKGLSGDLSLASYSAFAGQDAGWDWRSDVDGIQIVNAVPEPSEVVLLGFGAVLLFLGLRRKSPQHAAVH